MNEPWMDEGLCTEVDPDLFFPEKGGSASQAKKVCSGCPVRERCLNYALTNRIEHGVWGGLSPKRRRDLLAEQDLVSDADGSSPRVEKRREYILSLVDSGFSAGDIADLMGSKPAALERWANRHGLREVARFFRRAA